MTQIEPSSEDEADLALAVARLATDDGDCVSLDDVLAELGITRENLEGEGRGE